jgi:hypothetical protein
MRSWLRPEGSSQLLHAGILNANAEARPNSGRAEVAPSRVTVSGPGARPITFVRGGLTVPVALLPSCGHITPEACRARFSNSDRSAACRTD